MWWQNTLGSSDDIVLVKIIGNQVCNIRGVCDGLILWPSLGNPVGNDDGITPETNDWIYDGKLYKDHQRVLDLAVW